MMRSKGEVIFETLVAFVVQNHTEFITVVEQFEQFFIISNDRNRTIQVKFNKRKTPIVDQYRIQFPVTQLIPNLSKNGKELFFVLKIGKTATDINNIARVETHVKPEIAKESTLPK